MCACFYFPFLATWVGGAFIIGIAESVYNPTKGLTWALIPLQMSISFIIGKHLSLLHASSQYALFEMHKRTDAFRPGLDKESVQNKPWELRASWIYIQALIRINYDAKLSLPWCNIHCEKVWQETTRAAMCISNFPLHLFTKLQKKETIKKKNTAARLPAHFANTQYDRAVALQRVVCLLENLCRVGVSHRQLEVCKVCSSYDGWQEPWGPLESNPLSQKILLFCICVEWYFCRHQPESDKLNLWNNK